MKDFKYKTIFSSTIRPLVPEEKDKYLALASLADIGDFIPEIKVKTPYTCFATLQKVVDGDTLYVQADLGFYIDAHIKIRLLGINTPAIDQPKGMKAKKFLEKELTGSQLVIETRKKGKYSRYLATCLLSSELHNIY